MGFVHIAWWERLKGKIWQTAVETPGLYLEGWSSVPAEYPTSLDQTQIVHLAYVFLTHFSWRILLAFHGWLSNKSCNPDCPEGDSHAVQDSPEQKEKDWWGIRSFWALWDAFPVLIHPLPYLHTAWHPGRGSSSLCSPSGVEIPSGAHEELLSAPFSVVYRKMVSAWWSVGPAGALQLFLAQAFPSPASRNPAAAVPELEQTLCGWAALPQNLQTHTSTAFQLSNASTQPTGKSQSREGSLKNQAVMLV